MHHDKSIRIVTSIFICSGPLVVKWWLRPSIHHFDSAKLMSKPISALFCLSFMPPLIEAASVVAKVLNRTLEAEEQCIFISLLHTSENRLIADLLLTPLISENSHLFRVLAPVLSWERGSSQGVKTVLPSAMNLEQKGAGKQGWGKRFLCGLLLLCNWKVRPLASFIHADCMRMCHMSNQKATFKQNTFKTLPMLSQWVNTI